MSWFRAQIRGCLKELSVRILERAEHVEGVAHDGGLANPLLLVIMVVAFARAFQRARMDNKYSDLVDGSVRGAVVATLTILAVAQVATVGGPVGLSFLVGLVVGILANKAVPHVSVAEISRFLAERAKAAVGEIGSLEGLALPALPVRR